jgi:hypothetical protein
MHKTAIGHQDAAEFSLLGSDPDAAFVTPSDDSGIAHLDDGPLDGQSAAPEILARRQFVSYPSQTQRATSHGRDFPLADSKSRCTRTRNSSFPVIRFPCEFLGMMFLELARIEFYICSCVNVNSWPNHRPKKGDGSGRSRTQAFVWLGFGNSCRPSIGLPIPRAR